MNYEKIYNQIITRARQENRSKDGVNYYENHHIIPKCLNGLNEESNLVLLTGREHFICHWILTKIHPCSTKLVYAFWAMCNQKNKNQTERYTPSSRTYDEARKLFSENHSKSQSTYFQTYEGSITKKAMSDSRLSFFQTEEGRLAKIKLSENKIAFNKTEEGRLATTKRILNTDWVARTNKTDYKSFQEKRIANTDYVALSAKRTANTDYIARTANMDYTSKVQNTDYASFQERRVSNTDYTARTSTTNYQVFQKKRIENTDMVAAGEKRMKVIEQFTKEGEFIRDWPSLKEAKYSLGLNGGDISNCIKGRQKTAGGFIWKYKQIA